MNPFTPKTEALHSNRLRSNGIQKQGKVRWILGLFFLGVFVEDAVDLEEKFSHNGGEGDFGRFDGQAQARIKLAQDGFLPSRQDHCAHVESASHRGAASADVALLLQRATQRLIVPTSSSPYGWSK